MATKLEEANIAPASNPILAEGASSEKQPDPAPAAESSEKKVETATEGLGDLSLAENEKTTQDPKEEAVQPAAPSAPVTAATPAAPTTEAVQPVTEIEAPTKETAPTTEAAAPTTGPVWPETAADHPLTKFYDIFEDLVKESEHNEVYGIQLSKSNPFHTKLILQKFLRANQNDLDKAKQQLLETLKWRKEFDPVKAASETFNKTRFNGLGYVLEVEGVPESKNAKDIVTFNIYGAVKDKKATFGDLEGFLRWRVGLMEKSVQKLALSTATSPIPNFGEGPDPYQGFQVHDYLQVSFLRQDPAVKTATTKTIEVLGRYYPETLSRKFFVNVPLIMGWMYTAAKLIVAKETAKKFAVLSYGKELAKELGSNIPTAYGGSTGELETVAEGMTLED